MIDYRHYIRASHEMIHYVEPNIWPELDPTLESYLVQLLARYFRAHDFGQIPVAIAYMTASALPGFQKKQAMATIGDECLFISGFKIKQRRWPTNNYYQNMGSMAYGSASIAFSPMDQLYSHLESNFALLDKVLNHVSQHLCSK